MPIVVGCTFGVWDLLHIGHVNFLQRCKRECDRLIVGVPADRVVVSDKGDMPVIPAFSRLQMVTSLGCVDFALLYEDLEFMAVLHAVLPGILFVGDNWGKCPRHLDAETFVRKCGGRVAHLCRTPGVSSSEIRERSKQL